MTIIIGKLARLVYKSATDDFRVYAARASGGEQFAAVFTGSGGPKPLKTVEYSLFGEWSEHRVHGRRFMLQKAERFDRLTRADKDQARLLRVATRAMGEPLAAEMRSAEPSAPDPVNTQAPDPLERIASALEAIARAIQATPRQDDISRASRLERQAEGVRRAKLAGLYKGRPADTAMHDRVRKALASGLGIRPTARHVGCSTTTVLKVRDSSAPTSVSTH